MYKKLRYAFRFSLAVAAKYKFIIILPLAGLAAAAFLAPRLSPYLPAIRSTKRIALIGRFTLSSLPQPVQQQISIGLTSITASNMPNSAAALYWEATDSGKTYIFHINPRLHWQDGKPLDSHDIAYHFDNAQVSFPSNKEYMVTLKDPYAAFPALVSRPLIRVSRTTGLFSRPQIVGLGSYRISRVKNNGSFLENLTLVPVVNDSSLPNIEYYFYPSQQLARTAYKLGLVETISDLQDPGDLSGWANSSLVAQPVFDRYVAVFFNTQDPMFAGQSGKNLRLALSYAIDKSRWPNRAIGPIPPSSWAFNSDIKRYDQDLDKAQALLEKVEKVPSKIVITTVPAYLKVLESIKADWAKIGINTEVKVVPDIPQDFQALLIAQAIPIDPDQYNLWHSTRVATNLTQLKNPRIDKLLEDGRKTVDPKARLSFYQDFQKYLLEEAPAVFLFYPENYSITRK